MSDLTHDPIGGGRVESRELEQEMRSSFLDYAMSVIVSRALPDVRDGLKPVHRRVLYGMHENGLQPNRPYKKSANVVGAVMGNYHPHGDAAIYDTLVRMAQPFSLRYRSSTARATSARSTGIPPPRCAIRSAGSRGWPRRCCATSTPTPSTSSPTTTSLVESPPSFPPGSRSSS
jgi:hypothetical protein